MPLNISGDEEVVDTDRDEDWNLIPMIVERLNCAVVICRADGGMVVSGV